MEQSYKQLSNKEASKYFIPIEIGIGYDKGYYTDGEKYKIRNCIPNNLHLSSALNNHCLFVFDSEGFSSMLRGLRYSLKMYKFPDDWYYVYIDPTAIHFAIDDREKYYLCDQLDGLCDFVQDFYSGIILGN